MRLPKLRRIYYIQEKLNNTGVLLMAEPFHDGEIAIQKLTEERGTAMLNGGMLGNSIPPGAVPFIQQQHYAFFSSADQQGDIWISMLTGEPGFAQSNVERTGIEISLPEQSRVASDPVFAEFKPNAPFGGLFIELSTRRRLRINGRAIEVTEQAFTLDIEQAYPNCPKYIQRRGVEKINVQSTAAFTAESGIGLNTMARDIIAKSDTLFVGSADTDEHFDASHRGGEVGFVTVVDDKTLRMADYPGNSMFNTLGNFHVNPKAGLLFVDFDNNTQLHLTGEATMEYDCEADIDKTAGSGRWLNFVIKSWRTSPLAHDLDWRFVDYSPFNPKG
jgi:predicted pyridoxine 5'-phosphate oxidase superfamily flavin-nucleotide-binding protein